MAEDRTLDQFDDADAAVEESDGADRAAATGAADGRDAAAPVLLVTPDGHECDGCGETVTRLWRAGDASRCADCRSW